MTADLEGEPEVEPEVTTRVFLAAEWRYLAMLNYEVDPSLLWRRVPAGTELDSWQGRTFISVVAFRFLRTRVLGLPIPFHRNFDEVNLRFYVRRETPGGPRRGVVFIRELVPRAVIAWVARRVYNENYLALPMRHDIRLAAAESPDDGFASYQWRVGNRWNRLAVQVTGPAEIPRDDSQETFITEHYWGYASQRDGATLEYGVEHRRWRVWQAPAAELDCDVETLCGADFVDALSRPPSSAFVADGSAVVVGRGRQIPGPP